MTPVYTPPHGDKYTLCKKQFSKAMTPTECILHHGKVILVLDENHDQPVINAVEEVGVYIAICVLYDGHCVGRPCLCSHNKLYTHCI